MGFYFYGNICFLVVDRCPNTGIFPDTQHQVDMNIIILLAQPNHCSVF